MKQLKSFKQLEKSPYEEELNEALTKSIGPVFSKNGNARLDITKAGSQVVSRVSIKQKVEHETFVKVFKSSLKEIAKLSKTAQAILWYIMDYLPQDKCYVIIDNTTVMDYCGFKTRKSVRDGVVELLEKNFLTRTTVPKKFWVNPLIVFNGNRITYANEYILDEADED